jgi:elongation factor P--beta-lysine ligase
VISTVDDATGWRPTAKMSTLQLRAAMLARARGYFAATGALEVETPALVRAPVTDVHLESLRVTDDVTHTTQGFLQTSPEYGMKRLLCAGAPDIYQVCRVFRAAERGRRHNPEFTMIEWYRLIDDQALMRDVECFVRAMLEPHPEWHRISSPVTSAHSRRAEIDHSLPVTNCAPRSKNVACRASSSHGAPVTICLTRRERS